MMKRRLLFSFLFVMTLGLFSACSDDDKEKQSSPEGVYAGTLKVFMNNIEMSKVDNQEITLISVDETHYTLKLVNFKFNDAITVPLIQVNTTISEDGKVIGEAKDLEISLGELGKVSADVDVTGTVIADKALLDINVSAPLQPGTPPIKMVVKFDGMKK